MKPWKHAQISAHKFGGKPQDYIEIHNFFDESKAHVADMRHRIFLHNSFGIWLCERVFGTVVDGQRLPYITNSSGQIVQVRDVGEQHVIDDLGTIPSLEKCIAGMPLEAWMGGPTKKRTVTVETKLAAIKELMSGFDID